MKRVTLVLILLLCLCGTASADLGDPTVQAVCRIKLNNGRVIEGFITVAAGGYEGTHPSGFRFEAGSQQATHFLGRDFRKLVRDSVGNYRIVFRDGRVVNRSDLRKASKIVFLKWEVEVVNDQGHQQYKELDALTVVTELPYYLYIDPEYKGLRKGSVVTIPLQKIVSLELLPHPAKRWLDHIEEREQVVGERDDFEDYMEPDWYHEVLKDKESCPPLKTSARKRKAQGISTLITQLTDQNHGSFLQIKAARALRGLGPKAKPAIPALIAALKDDDAGFFAGKALIKLAPNSIAGLADALKNENERVHAEAVRLLGEIGPPAKPAIPALTAEILKREDASASFEAAQALSRIGSPAIPVLIEALKDHRDYLRRNAAGGLGRPEAAAAIPALIQSLKDSDATVREAAAQALGNIGQPAIPILSDALKNEDKVVRDGALSALSMIRPLEKIVIPLLIEALDDEDKSVRIRALVTLTRIGPEAKAAIPALVEALKDQTAGVRGAAAWALGAIGPAARDAVPVLIEALKDENETVRIQAASALRLIGPDAREAVPALIDALNDEKEQVRLSVAWALGVIDRRLVTILDQISQTSPEGLQIIEQIKAMKPEVTGQPSVLTLGQVVNDNTRNKGSVSLRAIGWEASQKANARWGIILHYQDSRAQYQKAEWEYDPETNRIYPFELQNAPRFWTPNSLLRRAASRIGILIMVCSSIALGCGLIIVFRKSLLRLLNHDQN